MSLPSVPPVAPRTPHLRTAGCAGLLSRRDLLHAGTVGEAYAFADSTGTPIDLGPAGFDANGTADVAVPATLAEGGYRIAVQFDELPLVWDAVRIGQEEPPGISAFMVWPSLRPPQ